MATQLRCVLAAALIAGYSQPVTAQMSAPPISSALPDVRSISPENAAGVLQYCIRNQLVSGAAAETVVGALTAKPGVMASPAYSAGQAGGIVVGGKNYSLGQLSSFLKSQSCDMVLRQARQFK